MMGRPDTSGMPASGLARLRRISELVASRVNLAGIARILDLQEDNAALHAANRAMGAKRKPKPSPGPA